MRRTAHAWRRAPLEVPKEAAVGHTNDFRRRQAFRVDALGEVLTVKEGRETASAAARDDDLCSRREAAVLKHVRDSYQ